MIAGVFLRNFKSFFNFNFIPLVFSENDKVSVFAGDNGAGKSTVLDAIDCILNKKNPEDWPRTTGQGKDRMQLFLLFLVDKSNNNLSSCNEDELENLSSTYWEADFQKYSGNNDTFTFKSWRDGVLHLKETHYIFCIGKNHKDETIPLGVEIVMKQKIVPSYNFGNLFSSLVDAYKYIYIPVESKIDEILSIKGRELSGIMGGKTFSDLDRIINEKSLGHESGKSVIAALNEILELFLDEINGFIEPDYKFSSKNGAIKRAVKANDFIDIIVNVFFATRPLQKNGKGIESLSSGQKRVALIDVFCRIIEQQASMANNLIIAIDEPESSLDSLNRFNQFQRLFNLPKNKNCQVFLTTHWYGAFLSPIKGRLNYLKLDKDYSKLEQSFHLEYLYDDRKRFPDSIEMKSYFDLMNSLYSLIRSDNINWIICEGRSDVFYLKEYIGSRVEKINIVAFNGFGNVKRLYELLCFALSEKEPIKGKVLFIIDTDTKNFVYDSKSAKNENIRLWRWHLDRSKDDSRLNNISSNDAQQTVIEDLIDCEFVYDAARRYLGADFDEKKYTLSTKRKHADITELGFLDHDKLIVSDSKSLRLKLTAEHFKTFMAESYINSPLGKKPVQAFESVIKFFSGA